MSTTVDQRVVQMQFDNKDFESNVQTSMNTVNKLKKNLDFSDTGSNFDTITKSAGKVDMSSIAKGTLNIRNAFSAMDVVAATVLSNVTSSAMAAGKNIVSALTLEPIISGFSEYELKMNSVQTIMSNTASKGTQMADITKVIDELNTYADKTIYSFSEMTRNIGTFTAAGIGLNDAATAIEGISNLAAASGSNAEQASTAMYQLSQALATGKVSLMDWNSVVNAGMGGEKFQEALKQTARETGVAIDDIIAKQGSFRDSLQEGWLTADILNQTLNKFTVDGAKNYAQAMLESGQYTKEQADALVEEAKSMEGAATQVKTFTQLWSTLTEAAQSGWGQSWEIITGNFDEAKGMFTDVSNVLGGMINASSDARNAVLQGWRDLGGRSALIDALSNSFQALSSVVRPIKEAFTNIFPPVTSQLLVDLTNQFKNFTSGLILTDEQSQKVRSAFEGLFSFINIGRVALINVISAIGTFLGRFSGLKDVALSAAEAVGDGLINVSNKLVSFLSKNGAGIDGLKNAMSTQASKICASLRDIILGNDGALQSLIKFKNQATQSFDTPGVDQAGESATQTKDAFGQAVDFMKSKWNELTNYLNNQDWSEWVNNLKGHLDFAMSELTKFKDKFEQWIGGFSFDNLTNKLNILLDLFLKFNGARALGGVGSFFKSLSDMTSKLGDALSNAAKSIGGFFDEIGNKLKKFGKQIKPKDFKQIAEALLMMAGSLYVISTIDSEKLKQSLGALAGLLGLLLAATGIMGEIVKKMKGFSNTKGTAVAVLSMVSIAGAVWLLSSALAKIGALDWHGMWVGLVGTTILMGACLGFIYVMSKIEPVAAIEAGIAMIGVATGVLILAQAVTQLSNIPFDSLKNGMGAVGACTLYIIGLIAVLALLDGIEGSAIMASAVAVLAAAVAIGILTHCVEVLAAIDANSMWQGVYALAAVMAMMIVLMAVIGAGDNSLSDAATVLAVATAINGLTSSVKTLGELPIGNLVQGMVAIGVALFILGAALKYFEKEATGIEVLKAAAIALLIMTVPIVILGLMPLDMVATGLMAVGIAMCILVAGANAMAGAEASIPVMLAMAGAMVIMAVAILILSTIDFVSALGGLALLAIAIAGFALAAVLMEPIIPVMAALAVVLIIISAAIIVFSLAMMLLSAVDIEGAVAGLIVLAGAMVVFAALSVISPLVIIFAAALIIVSVGIMAFSAATMFLSVAMIAFSVAITIFANTISGLIEGAPEAVEAVKGMLANAAQGVMDWLANNPLVQAGKDMISGLVEGLNSMAQGACDTIKGIADSIWKTLTGFNDSHSPSKLYTGEGENDIEGLGNGFGNQESSAVNTIVSIAQNASSSLASNLTGAFEAGSDFISGLVNGFDQAKDWVYSKVSEIGQNALSALRRAFDEHSPSKETFKIGNYFGAGAGLGILASIKNVMAASKALGHSAMDSLSKALAQSASVFDDNVDTNPTIRPVIDLSDVQNGAKQVSGLLDQSASVDMAGSIGTVASSGSVVSALNDALQAVSKSTDQKEGPTSSKEGASYTVEVPVYLEGRQIAKVSAPFTESELNKISKTKLRLGGVL